MRAPWSTQRPIKTRSSSVIRVLLFGGMVRVVRVLALITTARAAISSGVAKLRPPAAEANALSLGTFAWQVAQRNSTIPLTTANGTRPSASGTAEGGETPAGTVNNPSATMAAATAPQAQFAGRPLSNRIMQW